MSRTSGGADRSKRREWGIWGDGRAQSETIGVVLILGMMILGTMAIIGFGSQALNAAEDRSEVESVEQAMTQFDSKAAQVALGNSLVQSVPMGQTSEGRYGVHSAADWKSDSAAGSIKITHLNYDGAGTNRLIHEGGLGSVIYERDETQIAYQGGGVWRKGSEGDARMVSPPELYYQGSTLTLPIIQTKEIISGSSNGGGAISATIQSGSSATPVFPGPNPDGQPYENSIQSGEIKVTVQSEYAAGWAEYFVQRTDGEMCPPGTMPTEASDCTIGISGNVAELVITSVGVQGPFPMPEDESYLSVQGFKPDHPSFENRPYGSALDPFEITLRPDDTDSANFANLQWGMYVEQGNQEFEIHLRRQSGKDCSNPPVVSATIYYTNDHGNTYQGWYDDDAFTGECGDFDGDGDDEIRLVANLAGSNDMEYRSLSSSQLGDEVSASGASLTDPVTFDQHCGDLRPTDVPPGGTCEAHLEDSTRTYMAGSTETMGRLVDHYFTLLGPSFSLVVDDKNSNTVSEDASSGVVKYPNTANSITFLHVTENEIEVEFE